MANFLFGIVFLAVGAAIALSVRSAMFSGRIGAGTRFIADRSDQPQWYWFSVVGRCGMALFFGTFGIRLTAAALMAMLGRPH